MDPRNDSTEIISKTLEISYVFNESTGFGELNGSPIWVDRISLEKHPNGMKRSGNIMLSLDHPNFLRCLGSSPDSHDSKTLLIVYEGFTESLKEFMEREQNLVQKFEVPVASGAVNVHKLTYNSISRIYRQFMRQAIDFLLYLHHVKNMSLLGLNLGKHFVVKDSTLKLRCLRFSKKPTTRSKNNDFKHLAGVLREVFASQALPHDFEHLLTCMDNYDHDKDKVLLENHLAVLTSTRRVDMIKNFDERFNRLDSSQETTYHSVFSTMGGGYDWRTKLDGTHPEYGLIETVFKSGKSEYWIDETNEETKFKSLNAMAIKLSRNVAEHVNMDNNTMDKYKQNGQPFNDHTIESIIMAVFSEQLVDFQREAHKQGALEWLI